MSPYNVGSRFQRTCLASKYYTIRGTCQGSHWQYCTVPGAALAEAQACKALSGYHQYANIFELMFLLQSRALK
jgi:hypothetical protein